VSTTGDHGRPVRDVEGTLHTIAAMLPHVTRLLLVAALLAFPAVPASASLVEALDLDALVQRADRVVVARAVRQEARYDARGRIVTEVELEVLEAMKGDAAVGDRFLLTVLGGAIGDLGMRVEGEPRLQDGARYVLFARRWGADAWRPVGMSQGVMRVSDDGRDMVEPGGGGLSLVRRGTGGVTPATPALVFRRPLRVVVDQIRDRVAP